MTYSLTVGKPLMFYQTQGVVTPVWYTTTVSTYLVVMINCKFHRTTYGMSTLLLYVQSLVLCNLKQIKLLAYIDTLDAVMEALRWPKFFYFHIINFGLGHELKFLQKH